MFDINRESNLLNPDWPEAKWNLAGLFVHRKLLRTLIIMMKNNNILYALDAFHGCPDLIWNGGRINNNVLNFPDTAAYFEALNKLGIGVFLTFSNAVLEKRNLEDPDANRLLECLDEKSGLNGVIVVSDLMSDYIGQKKPGLKQICSVVKSYIENPEGDLEWYETMQARFDRVVVHTDHMFDLDLLDKLDRNRAEILVNEGCVYKCPNRKRHQTLNSIFNLAQAEGAASAKEALEKITEIKQTTCAGGAGLISEHRNPGHTRSCFLKRDEIKVMYDMGFRNFKLCGRRKPVFAMAWNVIHYLFSPAMGPTFSGPIAHSVDKDIRAEFQKLNEKEDVVPTGS
jgi:collagenase-like PrtC family protease